VDEPDAGFVRHRCLPLSIAARLAFVAPDLRGQWNSAPVGTTFTSRLKMRKTALGTPKIEPAVRVVSGWHSDFRCEVIMSTPPGYDLWVTDPNEFKDGIQAMSAVIETSWMPFTFNELKFTRPIEVRFEEGDHFVFLSDRHGLVERFNPTFGKC
jgi:hypothetical protein